MSNATMPEQTPTQQNEPESTCLYLSANQKITTSGDMFSINGEKIKKDDEANKTVNGKIYNSDFVQRIVKSENLLVLTGAGSSVQKSENDSESTGGSTLQELYEKVATQLPAEAMAELFKLINSNENSINKNLEKLINKIELYQEVFKDKPKKIKKLTEFKKNIIKIIREECSFAESV